MGANEARRGKFSGFLRFDRVYNGFERHILVTVAKDVKLDVWVCYTSCDYVADNFISVVDDVVSGCAWCQELADIRLAANTALKAVMGSSRSWRILWR